MLARTMYVDTKAFLSSTLDTKLCNQCPELISQEQDCFVLWTWSDVADTVERPGGFCLHKLTTRETAQVLGRERLQLGSLQANVSCSHVCLISSI